jgi:arginyl-tRNA synthetase
MQYAYARVRSIFRTGNENPQAWRSSPPAVLLDTPQEEQLALDLLRFPEAIEAAVTDYKPNAITSFLWDLANSYSSFYQHCSVLKAETPELRRSRLLLCDLTAQVLQKGLHLLGIETVEQM